MTKTINDLYLDMRRRLRDAGASMADLEARELTALATGTDKRQTANWGYLYVSAETEARAEALYARLRVGEPLAYLLGEWDFMGLTFKVTPDVLIPRSDTERLCELAIMRANEVVNPRVLDLCCGTGCIGITLLTQVDDARVAAVDISESALAVTRENAHTHGVSGRHISLIGDALAEPDEKLRGFHILISNPPYISAEEMRQLDASVSEYEPVLALFGGEDGLDFYRAIAQKWKPMILPGGMVLLECGYGQFGQVADIFEQAGFSEIEIHEDLSGVQRIVAARVPLEED